MKVSENSHPKAVSSRLKVYTTRHFGRWEDTGEPYCHYRFDVRQGFRRLLTIVAGVNIPDDGRVLGLDTLIIIDIQAHPTGTDIDYETGRDDYDGVYSVGIRLGTGTVRKLLRDILAIVRKDFPQISRIRGVRATGAKWKNQDRLADRSTDQRLTENTRLTPEQLARIKALNQEANWNIEILVNPSAQEMRRFAMQDKHREIRTLIAGGNQYVCQGSECTHRIMQELLDIPDSDIRSIGKYHLKDGRLEPKA